MAQTGAYETRTPGVQRWRLGVALGITAAILVAEIIGAAVTGSLALLVDAGHMVTDVAGLAVALGAATLATRPATSQLSWGWRRAEILAAGVQATILLAVGIYAIVEGIRRLIAPPEVHVAGLLLAFGILGLVGNIASLLVLHAGRGSSLNMRAAFLEVANDALGSVAVIVSAILLATLGWTRADSIAGLLIACLIIPRAFMILREAGTVLMEATPSGVDVEAIREFILSVEHVRAVHDLHITEISTGLPVLTAHVIVERSCFHDGHAPRILDTLQMGVAERFPIGIEHSTFQLEPVGHLGHEPELVDTSVTEADRNGDGNQHRADTCASA